MSAALPVTVIEPSEIAVAGFLARYREPTLSAYRRDLLCFWQWCADHQLASLAVRRPRLELHPLEFAAVLSAARRHGDTAHALVALLGMLELRVSEACTVQVTDLRYCGGYELLHVVGKGANPAEIPLPIPVLRAVHAATDGRTHGPILLSAKGEALTRGAASRLLHRVCPGGRGDQPGQPTRPAPDLLHRRADQRCPAP